MITLKTNLGDIKIELDFENAPVTAKNFQQYVEEGHYNGTIFHRVIKGFMAQGGGFAPGLDEKETRASIKNEANNGLSNKPWHVSNGKNSRTTFSFCTILSLI